MLRCRFTAYVACLWCIAAVAAPSPFGFEADVAGWHLIADEQSVSLTRAGLTWRSPLPRVQASARSAGVSGGCWKLNVDAMEPGGVATLTAGRTTSDGGARLEGSIPMPGGGSEAWQLSLGTSKTGELKFEVEVRNQTGSALPAPKERCLLKECYKYSSLDVSFPWHLEDGERIVGGGEQYSQFDLRGQRFELWSGEQGIGRGRTPITQGVDSVFRYCGGDRYTTYSHVPAFLSTRGYGVVLDSSQLIEVDFQSELAMLTVVFEARDEPSGVHFGGHLLGGPKGVRPLLPALTAITGRMSPLPSWTSQGIIVGTEGGHRIVSSQLEKLLASNVSVAGVWIQDWSGLVTTPVADHVWWNWELDETWYPKEWFEEWNAKGVRVTTYVNPQVVSVAAGGRLPTLFEEAKKHGYLMTDTNGDFYVEKQPKFIGGTDAAVINLLAPDAFDWWTQILRCQVLMACDGGPPLVHGYMNDYGEWLPLNAQIPSNLSSGLDGELATDLHNTFGRLSAAAAREAADGLDDTIFWSRSGDLHSPGKTSVFWAGDQLVSWDACDGMQSALIGTLSGGVSGWTLMHSDIGGYDVFDIPLPDFNLMRSAELLIRWHEMAVFSSAILRTHESSSINASAQVWDDEVLPFTRFLVDLFAALAPYRDVLHREAADTGVPPVRHGILVRPDDPTWFNASRNRVDPNCQAGNEVGLREFFLGDEVLVAPVFEAGNDTVDVYLPNGSWVHFWSGQRVAGPSQSTWSAPLGRPAFFYQDGPDAKWASFFSELAGKLQEVGSDLGISVV